MAIDPKQVQAAFLEVVAAKPDERAAVLDRVCAGDVELRRRVELLVRAHDDSGDRPAASGELEHTGPYAARTVIETPRTDLQPGDLFAGRFKLREKLGEGGMGIVWVADQTALVQRRIALKVIKSADDSRRLLARFEQERQALALMDHPNIAKVLDAGVSDDGRPYFVMELIKGVPFTKYCDEAKLAPRERLELFVPVCQAVQHAHQKGIIHRDLKPSNILIGLYDGRPVPKVIDFGVAKATGPQLGEQSIYTAVGAMIGTLEYMSPEQAELNNLDIDTRSDIYALGVILYELLTGGVPFSRKEMKAAGFAEMLRIIKEVEPPRPSTRLSDSGTLPSVAALRHMEPNKLMRLIRGELDWIVMKCLEKDRTRRYETANGLARDVQRYLADEVVEARPPSAGYRLKKFVRRHKGQVVAAGAVAAVLVLGIAGTTFGMVRASHAAEEERLAKIKASHAAEEERLAKNKAERAAEEERLAKNKAENRLRLIRSVINQFTNDLPSIGANLPLSEGLRRELLDLSTKLVKSFSDQNDLNDTYDYGIHALTMREAEDLISKQDYTAARQKALSALAGFQRILDSKPEMMDRARSNVATAESELGRIALYVNQDADAERHFQKALAIRREVEENPHGDLPRIDIDRHFATALALYGWTEMRLKRYENARSKFNEASALYEKHLQGGADRDKYESLRISWCKCQEHFADLETEIANREVDKQKALEHWKKVVHYYETIILRLEEDAQAFPASAPLRVELARYAGFLGRYYQDKRLGLPQSIKYFDTAVRNRRTLWDTKETSELSQELGFNYYRLGTLADHEKRPELAQKYFKRCLPFWTLRVHELEEKGEPADSKKMIDNKIQMMLVQGRVGMHVETARTAAVLLVHSRKANANTTKQSYTTQSAVGFGFCAVAFPPGSPERIEFFKKAMISLRLAVEFGWRDWEWLENDEDFDPLREWPEFQKAIDEWKVQYSKKK